MINTQKLAATLETIESAPAENTKWWGAFEHYLTVGHQWEEAAKLAWKEIDGHE